MTEYTDPPGFEAWEAQVPESFKRDPIWRTPAYRYGLWLAATVVEHRQELIVRIIRILSAVIPRERADRIGRARRTRTGRSPE